MDVCSYRDPNGIEHSFWDGEFVIKSIGVTPVGSEQITALGIETARSLNEVVGRVKRFLPEANVKCREYSPGVPICFATLGDGWITLTFDAARRLTEVRVDAYQFA